MGKPHTRKIYGRTPRASIEFIQSTPRRSGRSPSGVSQPRESARPVHLAGPSCWRRGGSRGLLRYGRLPRR
jgi:hypothetical protein